MLRIGRDHEPALAHAQQVVLAEQTVDPLRVHAPAPPPEFGGDPRTSVADAAWFCPALLVYRYGTAAQLGYVSGGTTVVHNGQSALSLTSAVEAKTGHALTDSELRRLSQTHLFLDPTSLVPVAFTREVHPANNSLINIALEARYSQYQTFNGVSVPMHIQRYMNGVLDMDIQLTAAQINTGLTGSTFHLQ